MQNRFASEDKDEFKYEYIVCEMVEKHPGGEYLVLNLGEISGINDRYLRVISGDSYSNIESI